MLLRLSSRLQIGPRALLGTQTYQRLCSSTPRKSFRLRGWLQGDEYSDLSRCAAESIVARLACSSAPEMGGCARSDVQEAQTCSLLACLKCEPNEENTNDVQFERWINVEARGRPGCVEHAWAYPVRPPKPMVVGQLARVCSMEAPKTELMLRSFLIPYCT